MSMERLTDKITNIETGKVLAYRTKRDVSTIKAWRKLGEYEDAEEQGLLVRLPYKPGDNVWCIEEYEDGYDFSGFLFVAICNNYIIVSSNYIHCGDFSEQLEEMCEESLENQGTEFYMFEQNNVFPTREEAKKVVEEMEEKEK